MSQKLISKLLVGVDFSEESKKALRFAISLSKQLGITDLVVVSVVKPIITSLGNMSGEAEVSDKEDMNIVSEQLQELVKAERGDFTERIKEKVSLGSPADTLIKEIEIEKPDMVIMGNKKHGFKKGILTGSVSARVSANSPVSVLIVR